MFDRQHGLDETCYSGGGVEVADVGLHRSKRAIAAATGGGTEDLCQRRHLDRISERGTSAMSLDIANLVSVEAGHRERPGDHLSLAVHARSGISDLPRAVVVDSRSGDDRVHAVAIGKRIVESSKHHDAASIPADGPPSICIESAAVAVRGEYATFRVEVACSLRDHDGNAPGECHVTLSGKQALAGQDHGHERA